ncbi:hypothetical protein HPB49_003388 [Dermacentor silvarum]|uniref:Uncharacterized protein n=1 Tax=Dermacentor silvarum TaxID=543639 RepID=A0ACB8D2I6_DERSI|nr:hypothetical protein HPB49_003388 [Dermacentor silvarum]
MDPTQPASTCALSTASTLPFASPPPAFLPIQGTPALPWLTWKRSFHTFLQAVGGDTLLKDRKKAVLLSNLGFEGQRLCYDLTLQVDPATLQFQDIIRLLDKHYEDSTKSLVHRIIFRDRRQQPGESFQEFCSAFLLRGKMASPTVAFLARVLKMAVLAKLLPQPYKSKMAPDDMAESCDLGKPTNMAFGKNFPSPVKTPLSFATCRDQLST